MKDRQDRPDQMPDLPESDASLRGATSNVMGGATAADCRQGYKVLDRSHDPFPMLATPGGEHEDTAGNTYVGDPWRRGGFLNRPIGSTER